MTKMPDMPLGLIISLILVAVGVLTFGLLFAPDVLRHFRGQEILKDGIPATAMIKAVEDTGNRYNKNPEIKLTLEVTPTNGKPYHTVLITVISVVNVPQYQPGTIVHVMYDPKQPTHVVLVNQ